MSEKAQLRRVRWHFTQKVAERLLFGSYAPYFVDYFSYCGAYSETANSSDELRLPSRTTQW